MSKADETGTAIARRDETVSRSELVQQGANLNPEEWRAARIAAAMQLLPTEFRDNASMIAFLARAQRSGLDPFLNEIWAWKNERGTLQFMTSRDGWLRLAREDPAIESLECGLVYEGDEFSATRSHGSVTIEHSGGIKQNHLAVMAYAVVHYRDGHSGELERRTFDDYQNLLNKPNWKADPNGMLLTRAVSAAIKFASPRAAGLYSPAHIGEEWAEEGESAASSVLAGLTERRTEELRARLAATRGRPADAKNERPIDVTPEPVVEEEIGAYPCEYCEQNLTSPQAKAGHVRGHSEERTGSALLEEAGARIERIDVDGGPPLFRGWLPNREEYSHEGTTWMNVFLPMYDELNAAVEPEPDDGFDLDGEGGPAGYRAVVSPDDPTTLDVLSPDGEIVAEGVGKLADAVTAAVKHVADAVKAQEAPQAPAGDSTGALVRLVDLLRTADELGLDEEALDQLIVSERWQHVFAKYGCDTVTDLPPDGRDDLLYVLKQLQHATADAQGA